MTALFKAPIYKTLYGKNSHDYIDKAKIIETSSGDYLIRSRGYDLGLTDDLDLYISDTGSCICTMSLTPEQCDVLHLLERKVESLYLNNLELP